jgi:pimeloyl-ACP methyl ester carboxylesterase
MSNDNNLRLGRWKCDADDNHADKFCGRTTPKGNLNATRRIKHNECYRGRTEQLQVPPRNLRHVRWRPVKLYTSRKRSSDCSYSRLVPVRRGIQHQIEPLSARYDVIALDQRSHGESQKVSYGLRISRLSKDLYELLSELDLNDVALLGHSMGSAVIWCYIDLFGPERLSKIILVDQPPIVIMNPHWTKQELEDSGAFVTAQQVFDSVPAFRSKEAEQVTRQIIDGMVTNQATSEMREWIVQCNLKMPEIRRRL